MPLVKAQCPNCNGNLEVDNSLEAAVCPFCGTPYIVEKAIQNITHNTNYYIENAVLGGEESNETQISRGLTFIKLNEGKSAYDTFKALSNKHPEDYRSWLGICISEYMLNETIFDTTIDHVFKTAPDDVKEKLGDFKVYSEFDISKIREEQQEHYSQNGYQAAGIRNQKSKKIDEATAQKKEVYIILYSLHYL